MVFRFQSHDDEELDFQFLGAILQRYHLVRCSVCERDGKSTFEYLPFKSGPLRHEHIQRSVFSNGKVEKWLWLHNLLWHLAEPAYPVRQSLNGT